MEIKVLTNGERTFRVVVDKESILMDFRTKVEIQTSIPIKEQRLLSRGKLLTSYNDFETVKEQEPPNVQVK